MKIILCTEDKVLICHVYKTLSRWITNVRVKILSKIIKFIKEIRKKKEKKKNFIHHRRRRL